MVKLKEPFLCYFIAIFFQSIFLIKLLCRAAIELILDIKLVESREFRVTDYNVCCHVTLWLHISYYTTFLFSSSFFYGNLNELRSLNFVGNFHLKFSMLFLFFFSLFVGVSIEFIPILFILYVSNL